MNLRRWLTPGIGVKRWLLVVFLGLLLLALAFAHLIRQVGLGLEPGGLAGTFIDLVTLQFLPYPLRGLIVGSIGVGLLAVGGYRAMRSMTDPLRASDADQPLVEVIYQKRFLARGPRIVTIGGGTGLSSLLRGLKEHTSNLTAVVTVADDGGSSGVLRTELGIPPVGDIRNCIAALADAEPLMNELLQYRFPVAEADTSARTRPGLAGHAVGNLLLAAMTAIEGGDFEEGVRRINRILAVRGQVVPVTATPLTLHARCRDGSVVDGQSHIMLTPDIERVWLTPDGVDASEDALAAIADAELIVLGPGSLFTSLLPSLLLPSIRDALLAASAPRLYVCNVATQDGETAGFDLAAHVEALVAHTAPGLVDIVLANNRFDPRIATDGSAETVRLNWPPAAMQPVPRLILDDVVDPDNPRHHDPARLAAAILSALEAETATRRRTVGGRPDVTRSERDLVTALRNELAAIDPARSCDRLAEAAGLGTEVGAREPAVGPARGPVAPGAGGGQRCAVRLGRIAAEHCRTAWLRGRFLARGSLSLAGGRTHLEFVVPPEDAPVLAARLREVGLPAAWRLRRGRGVVTWKSGEAVGTFLRRIGAAGALLELEARQVSRALRGELNRVLNAESANLQRAVAAAGRQLDAIAVLDADGRMPEQPYVVRLIADARRETPEATLTELAERLELHRSAVQRALERIERLAEAEPAPPSGRRASMA